MLRRNTENDLVGKHLIRIQFIDLIKVHIDKCQIKCFLLYQPGSTDRTVFEQFHGNRRVFLMKEKKHLREKECA